MAITPRRFTLVFALIAIVGVSCLLLSAQQKSVSVEGYVLDSACAFTKNLDKPISRECALSCAKAGSQLVILSDDGSITGPSRRPRLRPDKTSGSWSSLAAVWWPKESCTIAVVRTPW